MLDILNPNLSTEKVAQELLGHLLISETPLGRTSGWIVETEAYVGAIDQAAHSYRWHRTPRVEAMYAPPGTIYLYQMMGHVLLNVITKAEGEPQGVLIRAIEPNEGIDLIKNRRGVMEEFNLTNGPGKLSQALDISMDEYGTLITQAPLYIDFSTKRIPLNIVSTSRIGIPNKGEWTEKHLRFIVEGNPYVSHRRGKMDYKDHGWLH